MIQIIAGKKGSGKTKRLIDLTNTTAAESHGSVVFLDDDNSYMFDIDRKVRFVNASDYHVKSAEMFVGFLCGMLSQNFDISTIFIDAFTRLCKTDLGSAGWIFDTMNELSDKNSVNFVLSVSAAPDELPEFMQKYII